MDIKIVSVKNADAFGQSLDYVKWSEKNGKGKSD